MKAQRSQRSKKRLPCKAARGLIRSGDVLLFPRRGSDLVSDAIAVAGRSEIIHAGMAAWINRRLYCLETVQWHGGRKILLSRYAKKQPVIIVKRPKSSRYSTRRAVAEMKKIVGKPYGWSALWRASWVHLPIIRWFVRPSHNDAENGDLPYCSMAVSRALRAGGVDPVERLADGWTEPGNLDQSAALRDVCVVQLPAELPAELPAAWVELYTPEVNP